MTLDYNRRPRFATLVNAADRALAPNQATRPPRDCLGGSRLGHALEDLAVAWLRNAGFDLYPHKDNRPDSGQFGFSDAGGRIRGHVDGIIAAGRCWA